MKVDYLPHITLAETRSIIQSVRKLFNFDLGVYSPANLQLILSDYIHSRGIQLPDVLISRMTDYPNAYDELLHSLEAPDSEMFRDPEIWALLQTRIIPSLLKEKELIKIWFPSCSSGEELFSLVILAIEGGFRDQISLLASSASGQRIKEAKKGLFGVHSMEINEENYKQSGGKNKLDDYFENIDMKVVRKIYLAENIEFFQQGNMPEKRNELLDLIIYNNRLIYYTPEARLMVLKNLLDSLRPGGYLILGYREAIRDEELLSRLRLTDEEGKIYQLI